MSTSSSALTDKSCPKTTAKILCIDGNLVDMGWCESEVWLFLADLGRVCRARMDYIRIVRNQPLIMVSRLV